MERSESDLFELEESVAQQGIDWHRIETLYQSAHPSTLTVTDVITGLLIGTLGGLISTNDEFREYCDSVHQDASKNKSATFLGSRFSHKGDNIDLSPGIDGVKKFIDRHGDQCGPSFHRVMFGHDPFSLHGDNPFVILTEQHGFAKGTLKTVRHLLGDTFSKQGLPIPFHSYFDVGSDSDLGNLFAAWSIEASKGTSLSHNEAFGQLFSLRAQDITGTIATAFFAKAYFKLFGIEDPIRQCQFKLIAYSTTFVSASIRFYMKTGVPGINWPCILLLLKELWMFFRLNYRDIKNLEQRTGLLVERNKDLEIKVYEGGLALPSLSTAEDYFCELRRGEANLRRLF